MKGMSITPDLLRAYAEGRKTVTRRLSGLKEINQEPDAWKYLGHPTKGQFGFVGKNDLGLRICRYIKPPYQVGEVVYLKEAWRESHHYAGEVCPCYKLDNMCQCGRPSRISVSEAKWRSPLFMPAWAARYFAKVVEVRPERLILPLSPDELEKEGGNVALSILTSYDGLWVWRILLESVDKLTAQTYNER